VVLASEDSPLVERLLLLELCVVPDEHAPKINNELKPTIVKIFLFFIALTFL
jgi:hypothetical protein